MLLICRKDTKLNNVDEYLFKEKMPIICIGKVVHLLISVYIYFWFIVFPHF